MLIFAFLIPLFISCILLFKYSKKTAVIEYLLLFGASILFYFMVKCIMVSTNTTDTEYIGNYIEYVKYYEPWDEMVLVTKTRQVYEGTDKDGHPKYRTETYTEWEHRNHSEEWVYKLHGGSWEHSISQKKFNMIQAKLQAKPEFIDMHRHYHRIDGDAYIYKFDGTEPHCYTVSDSQIYKNKVRSADHSIFNFHKLDKETLRKYPVYDYPDIERQTLDQCPIIGFHATKTEREAIQYINGYYGKKYQIRLYILVFNTDDPEIAEIQRSYWEGGNKNELVICIGTSGRTIKWCRTFSWSEEPALEVKIRSYFQTHKHLNLVELSNVIKPNLKHWHRKEFKDFEYLNVELTHGQSIAICILLIILNIGISIFIVTNELDNDIDSNVDINKYKIKIINKYKEIKRIFIKDY